MRVPKDKKKSKIPDLKGSSGWTTYDSMDGYYFSDLGLDVMDWSTAVSTCESMGGTVADFLTEKSCPGCESICNKKIMVFLIWTENSSQSGCSVARLYRHIPHSDSHIMKHFRATERAKQS